MAKNYIQSGHSITVASPSGGVESGDPVLIGILFGIAQTDAAEGDPVVIGCDGVYDIVKVSTDVFAVGGEVYFDTGTEKCTSDDDDGANRLIGIAVAAAANPSATVRTKIGNITSLTIVTA